MTAKRPLFLQGYRIVDADGDTVRELTPEQRTLVLRIARHRALSKSLVDPEDDPVLGPVIAAARRRMARLSPEEIAAARARVDAYVADVRRRGEEAIARRGGPMAWLDATLDARLPDSLTERFPLTD